MNAATIKRTNRPTPNELPLVALVKIHLLRLSVSGTRCNACSRGQRMNVHTRAEFSDFREVVRGGKRDVVM